MEPESFTNKPSEDEQAEYNSAILFGYQQMDELVGKYLALVDEDTTIAFASALGQQPCLKYEDTGGKVCYRPNDPEKLFRFAGMKSSGRYAPVMSEQFRVYTDSEPDAQDAAARLGALKIDGCEVMLSRQADNEVFAGCSIFERVDPGAVVTSGTGASAKFYDLFYNCNLVKSGMHHPDGIFWVRTPQRVHMQHEEKIPLDRVAPTLLTLMGVPQPSFMKAEPVLINEPALTAQ